LPILDFVELRLDNDSACDREVPRECAKLKKLFRSNRGYFAKWWNDACDHVPAAENHRVLRQYIYPHLLPGCKKVIEEEQLQGQRSLLIHLRADDLYDEDNAKKRLWMQAPCAMFEKIIREGGFTRVRILTDAYRKHACIEWLQKHPLKTQGVSIELRDSVVWEDYCALVGAQHIVVSESSFSHTAAVFGEPRTIHMFGEIWDARHWLLNCQTLPGTKVLSYRVPDDATSQYPKTLRGVVDYQRSYPWQQVLGPLPCSEKR